MKSEPTLYQWTNTDSEAWDDLLALHDTLVADGVLVIVGRDHEAITRIADLNNVSLLVAEAIVDAAFGIGGDDE